jgi:hypothetical protein
VNVCDSLPDTTWKADEACCEWNGPPPTSSDCPQSNPLFAGLAFDAATGLCENTLSWAASGVGSLRGAGHIAYAVAPCYGVGTAAHVGDLWSTACNCTYPPPPFHNTAWDGCQCVDQRPDPMNPFGPLIVTEIGCPSDACLDSAGGAPAPEYGLVVRPDTGCCGEPRVWGCPAAWEPSRGAGAAPSSCDASDPGGDYTDNCIPQCFTPGTCPPGYTRDPATGLCIAAPGLWPAALVTRWKDYYRADAPDGNLWFHRGSPGHPPTVMVEVTSAGTDSRPSLAQDFQERAWILFARETSPGTFSVYETHSDSDGDHWTSPTVAFSGGKYSAQCTNPHTGTRLAAALVGTHIEATLFLPDGSTENFRFKDTAGVDLVFADDGFGLSWSPEAAELVTGAFHISGESATSDWISVDDARHWARI